MRACRRCLTARPESAYRKGRHGRARLTCVFCEDAEAFRRAQRRARLRERAGFLLAHYADRGPAWCARELGLPKSTVTKHAAKLGLRKHPRPSP